MRLIVFIVSLFGAFWSSTSRAAVPPPPAVASRGEILAVEGKVEWVGQTRVWEPAVAGRRLAVGDGLRTGEYSRATLRLPAGSVLRIDEFTTLLVQESATGTGRPSASVTKGNVYFFSRTLPEELDFSTPVATGAIKGTEVVISVGDSGASSFIVLDGNVGVTPTVSAAAASVQLVTGEQVDVQTNGQATRSAVLNAVAPVQWALHYPAVLDPAAAEPLIGSLWRDAWLAYRRGALPAAIQALPAGTAPSTDAERLITAALGLAAGAHELAPIRPLSSEPARALRVLAAIVAQGANAPEAQGFAAQTATGWLAVSYARQSAADLPGALAAARAAVSLSPDFGYAWARVGELEFASGRRAAADLALERALSVSPDLASARAVRGFAAAADARRTDAEALFDEALRLDPALAPARLGLGILAHGRGNASRGRRELVAAAALDPTQSLPRSYLAKAWLNSGDRSRARNELEIATRLDPADPTPSLYRALLAQQENRPNDAVTALERSIALNDNRRIYRSRYLLDEDRAVRRTDLAVIYDLAGARELAFREASQAVRDDPSNFSAHLFLAHAYDQQRDPLRINLRYETPWSGSLLLARLLAPATAGALTPSVGLGEYTRLFEPPRFTLRGEATWLDSGEKRFAAVHTGNLERTHYALEFRALRYPGERQNQDFSRNEVTVVAAHELTPDDVVVAQAFFQNLRGGDLRAGIPETLVSGTSRIRENQAPIANVGYRHRWQPGSDTLVLGARLETDFRQEDARAEHSIFVRENNGSITPIPPFIPFASAFKNQFTLYHAELAHLEQRNTVTLQVGGRFQRGRFAGANELAPTVSPPGLFAGPFTANVRELFQRTSLYGYGTWKFAPGWTALAGVSGDWIEAPSNLFTEPITAGRFRKTRASPKAGMLWQPNARVSVRAAHTQSVGGISFEESFRLEPVQFGGFTQGVRSLIPEAVAGGTVAPNFELDGVGITFKAPGRAYLDFEAQERRSSAERFPGAFILPPLPVRPQSILEQLELRERQLAATATWLISSQWTLFGGITWLDTEVSQVFPIAPALALRQRSRLWAPRFRVSWNSPTGLFWRMDSTWLSQRDVTGPITSARHAWNTELDGGYRARSLRWSVSVGVVNAWDADLAFGALTVSQPLPLRRAFFARTTWSF